MTKLYSTLSRNFSRKDLVQAQQNVEMELVIYFFLISFNLNITYYCIYLSVFPVRFSQN